MTKKKRKSKKKSQQSVEVDPSFVRWTQTDYLDISTNLLAHVRIHDSRDPLEIQYGDEAEYGDIYLDNEPDPTRIKQGITMSDAEIFHSTLSQLITNGMECALDNLNRQKESKFKEGISSVNAGLFSALYDVIFLRYNFDVATGYLDVPSQEIGETLIKKVALFSETLESFKRDSKTRKVIATLKNQMSAMSTTHSTALKEKETELNAIIKGQKDSIKALERELHALEKLNGDIDERH